MKTGSLQLFFDAFLRKKFHVRNSAMIFSAEFLPFQQIQTNWHAITGPPCAGKTTVLKAFQRLAIPVIHESGRLVIESALKAGFSTDEIFLNQQLLQEIILKVKIITHLQNPAQMFTVIEDGIPESLAYFRIENIDTTGFANVFDLFRYRKIFYLDALPLANDPARPHSQQKVNQLGEIKKRVHQELGYEVIEIPVLPVRERVALMKSSFDEAVFWNG